VPQNSSSGTRGMLANGDATFRELARRVQMAAVQVAA
jgi:hypothetical protein